SVKTKPAAVKAKDSAEMPKPIEMPKPKPAAVKTKEVAEKPKPAENVKEVAEKPKEPVGDDYQVVHAATVMKAEDREEFEVETFTQWIEGNIDWVGEDELHDWPRVFEPINTVQPSTPKRVFSSPSKGYVKPVKTVNTPYMCRRIDVTARCKRIEFVLGNSLFVMEGDKYETVFKSLGGYRELSSNQGIIKGTLTEEKQWKSFYDEIKAQFKYEPSSMSLSDFELVNTHPDNSYSGYGYALKYKEACDPL
nr:ulp1 protease family, C-terminal catalytic domain-containing protein [Tanacetum cinerariifolium]